MRVLELNVMMIDTDGVNGLTGQSMQLTIIAIDILRGLLLAGGVFLI
jgi:hypothetical protein